MQELWFKHLGDTCPAFVKNMECRICKRKGHSDRVCWFKGKPTGAVQKETDKPKKNSDKKKENQDKKEETEKSVSLVAGEIDECFKPHVVSGVLMQGARWHRVKIPRDAGAAQTMVLQELVGKQEKEHVICEGVGGERFSVPLAEVDIFHF